jgi:hypothetical protein
MKAAYTPGKNKSWFYVLIVIPLLLSASSHEGAAAHTTKRKIRAGTRHLQSASARGTHKQLAKRPEVEASEEPAILGAPVTAGGEATGTGEKTEQKPEKTEQMPEKSEQKPEKSEAPAQTAVKSLPVQDKPESTVNTSQSADPSLISILSDMTRMIADASGQKKLKDESSRTVLLLAGKVLEKSLEKPNLGSDRVIGTPGKKMEPAKLTCCTWVSGEVKVADNLTGSVAAIWAKRPNGVINVTVGGDASGRQAPNGKSIGQFVVVLSGRSSVQKGLDIQSRADVNYWLAELSQITVESDCCSSVASISTSSAKQLALKKANFDSSKTVKAELKRSPEENKTPASSIVSEQKQVQSEPNLPNRDLFRIAADGQASSLSDHEADLVLRPEAHADKVQSEAAASNGGETIAPQDSGRINYESSPLIVSDEGAMAGAERLSSSAYLAVLPVNPERRGTSRTAQPEATNHPELIFPQRAVAGEPLTVSVISDTESGAPSQVELSFNGQSVRPDEEGKAVYNVPEDATPGRSLNITAPGGLEGDLGIVEVLQPLDLSSKNLAPHIDSVTGMVRPGEVLAISGHNFKGVWRDNSVLIDDSKVPALKASSPVQIKVIIPKDIEPGKHTVAVYCRDTHSNSASFETQAMELKACSKQATKNSTKQRVKKGALRPDPKLDEIKVD